jgi:hypothetical protein
MVEPELPAAGAAVTSIETVAVFDTVPKLSGTVYWKVSKPVELAVGV